MKTFIGLNFFKTKKYGKNQMGQKISSFLRSYHLDSCLLGDDLVARKLQELFQSRTTVRFTRTLHFVLHDNRSTLSADSTKLLVSMYPTSGRLKYRALPIFKGFF